MKPISITAPFAVVLLTALITAGEPKPLIDDEQDLVLMNDSRPILVRLHVRINDRPLHENWARYFGTLFRQLDRNADGWLDARETALAPNVAQLRQQIEGVVTVEPEPAPELAELDVAPRDGKVSTDELGRYYRRHGVGPLQVEYSWRQGDKDALGEALFLHLDTDRDGKLTRAEVALEGIRRFDLDDNELISALEVMPRYAGSGMVAHTPTRAAPPPPANPFALAQRGDEASGLGSRLVKRYDADEDGKLTVKEIGLDRRLFLQLDGDRDGTVSSRELDQWPSIGPDLEVVVPLGLKPGRERFGIAPGRPTPGLTTSGEDHGGLSLTLTGSRVELIPRYGTQADPNPGRKAAEEHFEELDGNDDGLLESNEIYRDPFDFVGLLRLADRNGDGKLARGEVKEHLDVQAGLLACSTFLTLSDRGRATFELIDADHDGRWNLREASTIWERLKPFDSDGDGGVTREEMPRQFLLTTSHGQIRLLDEKADRLGYGRAFQFGERVQGPTWYRKMDRNRDGDVSRREFLGSATDFQKLDVNGDGFLTLPEADRADAAHRK